MSTPEARARRMRVALTLFPALYICLGAVFLLQDPARTSGAAFESARSVPGGIHTWGAAFLILGFIQSISLASHVRWFTVALIVGSALVWFWVFLVAKAAADSHLVSWSSAVWVGGIGVLHWIVAWLIPRSDMGQA